MKIISVASAIPENSVGNDVVESRLGLDRGWIERRTGILRRPTASPDEATSDLAVRAGALALATSGDRCKRRRPAPSRHQHTRPPVASDRPSRCASPGTSTRRSHRPCRRVQRISSMRSSWAAVMGKACDKPVLVVAANLLTRRVNPLDAATVSLFSDGAGAVVLAPGEPSHLLGSYLGADGSAYDAIGIQAGGTRELLTPASLMEGRHLMTMRHGRRLFKKRRQRHGIRRPRSNERRGP